VRLKKLTRRVGARAFHVVGPRMSVARGTWNDLVDRFNALELSENAILLGFGLAVGVAGALGVVGFYKLIDLAFSVFYRWPATFLSRSAFLAYRPLLTGAGLATAWWVMRRLGRGHQGLNVPDVQLSVARREGPSGPRRPRSFPPCASTPRHTPWSGWAPSSLARLMRRSPASSSCSR
jgi:hypothetical protein